ncbi:MAG TPA: class D sortase [Vicinamibacterales bacterium]|nr:class D sortase [Vicinamibacterales bacterium]
MIHTIRRWLARLLIAGGAAAVIWVVVSLVLASSHRRQDEAALEQMRTAPVPEEKPALPASLSSGEPIGTLELVRVGLSGVVVEGDEDAVLDRAIGHLPDTPLPWNIGNSALAAHRDALFRPLKGVRLGDILRLKTPHGDFDYRVNETLIVNPEDVWVLDPTPVSTLTLISCYPFNFIGHAPKRFIVRAEQIPSNTPDVNLEPVSLSSSQ